MTEPIEKCKDCKQPMSKWTLGGKWAWHCPQCDGYDKEFRYALQDVIAPIEKITDETVIEFTEVQNDHEYTQVMYLKEPYRTMLLTSAEKDARIKELEANWRVLKQMIDEADEMARDDKNAQYSSALCDVLGFMRELGK